VAGDLFVHLFSGVHLITDTHGPTRALATGGLRFWKDGRDVPDVMMALYDYEKGFNLSVRTNFVDGGSESEGFVFTGSEGSMVIAGDGVTVRPCAAREGAGGSRRPVCGGDSEAHAGNLPREISGHTSHRATPAG
jgi:hypothetical protein